MVAFSGFDTVGGLREASRQGKAKKAADKMSIPTAAPKAKATTAAAPTEKPLTNTSGTAQKKSGTGTKQLMKQIEFGQRVGGAGGAMSAFMGLPFGTRRGGRMMTADVLNQQIIESGSDIKAPASSKPAIKKTPVTSGSGIDAPAPDTGWRPSGVNTASGLQSVEMGVPLQETVGVSKRKR